MDYSMPECNGPEATRQIRELLNERGVPKKDQPFICLLTAYVEKKFHIKAMEAGMDCSVPKPIFKDSLRKILVKTNLLGSQ